jgi:hypothetical protein
MKLRKKTENQGKSLYFEIISDWCREQAVL